VGVEGGEGAVQWKARNGKNDDQVRMEDGGRAVEGAGEKEVAVEGTGVSVAEVGEWEELLGRLVLFVTSC
jgi:hypothetical protein